MKKYYDQTRNCLVYIGEEANEEFWDASWQSNDFQSLIKVGTRKNKFFVDYSKKYLRRGARILEGGCGRGDKVYSLQESGFDAYGIDYAPGTIEKINRYAPELRISLGDVRNIDFPTDFFDGYWSLGVIEHFFNGYEAIQSEMSRVLRTDGYLFLTIPAMSWLRRQKARCNYYPIFQEDESLIKNFYQFALDPARVINSFRERGFRLAELKLRNGFIGLNDEISWAHFRGFMNKVGRDQRLFAKRMRKVFDILTTPFANHGILCVFQKIHQPHSDAKGV